MALISLRQLQDNAAVNDCGFPAFNADNLEQVRAIMEGAESVDSLGIFQASTGAMRLSLSEYKSERDGSLICK
tara:strand:+ start:713 stop:931 length:219 start_codon:yes stop_codon:yes gene_type:complete